MTKLFYCFIAGKTYHHPATHVVKIEAKSYEGAAKKAYQLVVEQKIMTEILKLRIVDATNVKTYVSVPPQEWNVELITDVKH